MCSTVLVLIPPKWLQPRDELVTGCWQKRTVGNVNKHASKALRNGLPTTLLPGPSYLRLRLS